MNEQHLGERVSTSEFVEEPDKDMNSPVVDSDPIADKVPADAALIHGMPMGGTDAAVGPTGEPITPKPLSARVPDHRRLCLTVRNQSFFARAGMRSRASLWTNRALLSSRRMRWCLR